MSDSIYTDKFMYYFMSNVPELGAASIMRLTATDRPLSSILYTDRETLITRGNLTEKQADSINLAINCVEKLYEDYLNLSKYGIRFICIKDDEYPHRLRNIPKPPQALYVKGELPSDDVPSVAIVGSRGATNYGLTMAEFVAESLTGKGVEIISGMAAGIDGAAHRGCLKCANGKSYAILGGGVNVCYPKENYDIYEMMSEGMRGGVISETAPGISPLKAFFPMRNRIISGLSDIVIVIEARERSGSLITVEHAIEQNREVMALPGRMTDPLSRGCNRLIKTGAGIITSPDDVLEMLGIIRDGEIRIPENNINLLANNQKRVYSCLNFEPKFTEDIATETGLSLKDVMTALLELELMGYITQVSGNYYGISIK